MVIELFVAVGPTRYAKKKKTKKRSKSRKETNKKKRKNSRRHCFILRFSLDFARQSLLFGCLSMDLTLKSQTSLVGMSWEVEMLDHRLCVQHKRVQSSCSCQMWHRNATNGRESVVLHYHGKSVFGIGCPLPNLHQSYTHPFKIEWVIGKRVYYSFGVF